MFRRLKESGRLPITMLLIGMSLFCLCLSLLRFHVSETKLFLFLNWNLFLAFIPWALSTVFILYQSYSQNKIALFVLMGIWVVFFPNSPYILTDLFHLRLKSSIPIWYDLVLILSFAWTGLIYGFISLFDMEILLKRFFKTYIVSGVIVLLLFLSSFGIYLGRYLRWNSWDLIQEPTALLSDISNRIAHPFAYPATWGMTVLLGLLLNMMFWTIKLIVSQKTTELLPTSSKDE